jgi:hypothetical protein
MNRFCRRINGVFWFVVSQFAFVRCGPPFA